MRMDGVTVTDRANEGVDFVNRVKSTRAVINLTQSRLKELSSEDLSIISGPWREAKSDFDMAACLGWDLDKSVGNIHKWFLAIDELAEKT